ncbi:MAG: methyltransferase domain-containing protein [Myxococcales bacterium]|nr:methyltransferase domain-containing protein [Myxococcales bacterium]
MAQRLLLRLIGLWNVLIFGVFTALLLAVAGTAQPLAAGFDPQRRVSAWLTRWLWGRVMIGAHAPFWRVTTTGLERLGTGPWVLAANHQSVLDIPLVTRLPVPVRILARPGVFRMPLFGTMARFGGHICLDAESRQALDQTMASARDAVAAGASVLVFPEGTRGEGSELQPFNRGAFELAIQAGADVLPIAISGTADAVPKGSIFARVGFARFHLQVLEPVPVAGETRRRVSARVRERIEAALKGPRPWEVTARVKEQYRALGRRRAGWAFGKTTFDPVFWALHERMPMEGRWLDVGCGEGLLAAYLDAAGHTLDTRGFDPDIARVAQAQAQQRGVFEVADVRTADLGTGYDVITCIDVLHYLTAAEQKEVVDRLVNALRPGGLLIVRDPDASRGVRGALTVGAERALVAGGRHQGEGVVAQGIAGLTGLLGGRLSDLRAEDCSHGTPFANVLLSGRTLA